MTMMRLNQILGSTDPSIMEPRDGEEEVYLEDVPALILGIPAREDMLKTVPWDKASYLFHVYVSQIHPQQYDCEWEFGEFEMTELKDPQAPGHWMGDDFREVLNEAGEHICYMHFIHGDGDATCFTVDTF